MFCYCYNKYNNLKDLGQSLGGYEFSSELMLVSCVHLVNIFTCNLWGYKYHIIKTTPFAFRDKSKDVK